MVWVQKYLEPYSVFVQPFFLQWYHGSGGHLELAEVPCTLDAALVQTMHKSPQRRDNGGMPLSSRNAQALNRQAFKANNSFPGMVFA